MPRHPPLPPSPERSRSRRGGVRMLLLVAAVVVGLSGCRADSPRDPTLREPALLIDGRALVPLLERLVELHGTPMGTASSQLLQRLRGCSEIAAHFARPTGRRSAAPQDSAGANEVGKAPFAARLDQLACRDAARLDPALTALLERERSTHAGLLQWPRGEAGRLVLRIDVDEAGGLAVAGFLDGANGVGPAALLVPGTASPGPAAIDPAASLVHLRLRPANGLRLAELIAPGSQGDRLFALKGRLLEGALLEGTPELGFVAPAPGGAVPLAIVALHHRAAGPIAAALGEALDQLERTWGLARTPRAFAVAGGARDGGCYADVPILPEFAPCWVVTDDALLIGYRAEAVEAALAASPLASSAVGSRAARAVAAASTGGNDFAADPAPGRATDSAIVVDFDRVLSLDASLTGPAGAGLATLYSRLELHGRTGSDGRVVVEGQLRARR